MSLIDLFVFVSNPKNTVVITDKDTRKILFIGCISELPYFSDVKKYVMCGICAENDILYVNVVKMEEKR